MAFYLIHHLRQIVVVDHFLSRWIFLAETASHIAQRGIAVLLSREKDREQGHHNNGGDYQSNPRSARFSHCSPRPFDEDDSKRDDPKQIVVRNRNEAEMTKANLGTRPLDWSGKWARALTKWKRNGAHAQTYE